MSKSGWISTNLFLCVFGSIALCSAQSPQSKNPSPLLDAAGHVRQEAYVTLPVPAADKVYEKIDGRRIKEKDLEVVAISRQSRDAATNIGVASLARSTKN